MENDRCRASSMSHTRCEMHSNIFPRSFSCSSLLSMNPPNEGLKVMLRVDDGCGESRWFLCPMMFLSSSSSSLSWPTIVVVRRFTHHNHHRYYRPVLRRQTTNHATTSNHHHHSRPYRPFGIMPLKFISFVITFGSLNIMATYTHYHDDYFHTYFPFPIAFDVGVGASMLPTIGCKQDNNDTTANNINGSNLYLRDCSSHRFIWLNTNNFYQYCIFSTNKLSRTLLFGGTTTTEHVEEV